MVSWFEFVTSVIAYIANLRVNRSCLTTSLTPLRFMLQYPETLEILHERCFTSSCECKVSNKGQVREPKLYLENLMKRRLLPFIDEHHSDGKFLFWPELAPFNQALSVTSFFEKKLTYLHSCSSEALSRTPRTSGLFWSTWYTARTGAPNASLNYELRSANASTGSLFSSSPTLLGHLEALWEITEPMMLLKILKIHVNYKIQMRALINSPS